MMNVEHTERILVKSLLTVHCLGAKLHMKCTPFVGYAFSNSVLSNTSPALPRFDYTSFRRSEQTSK